MSRYVLGITTKARRSSRVKRTMGCEEKERERERVVIISKRETIAVIRVACIIANDIHFQNRYDNLGK